MFKKFFILSLITFSLYANNDFISDMKITGEVKPSLPVNNATIEQGKKLFNEKEYEKAGDIFATLFTEGNFESTTYLAQIFALGLGIERDCKKAAFFVFSGLKENICDTNKVLSDWYKNGICTNKNLEKSEKYESLFKSCLK